MMLAPPGYSIAVRKGLRDVIEEVAVRLGIPEDVLWSHYESWERGTGTRASMR